MITVAKLLNQLADKKQWQEENAVIYGQATIVEKDFIILGVKETTFLGAQQALIMAEKIIGMIERGDKSPLLLLVDVAGQQLAMRDEWLGMHQYFAHLLECLACLRQQGNPIISLVYNQALGGGFIAYGLMADTILALPDAQLAVMWLEGIAKVTKIDLDKLEALSKTLPIFAPGVENFYKLGGLHGIVSMSDLSKTIVAAVEHCDPEDRRAKLGSQRGGRLLAEEIMTQIVAHAS